MATIISDDSPSPAFGLLGLFCARKLQKQLKPNAPRPLEAPITTRAEGLRNTFVMSLDQSSICSCSVDAI